MIIYNNNGHQIYINYYVPHYIFKEYVKYKENKTGHIVDVYFVNDESTKKFCIETIHTLTGENKPLIEIDDDTGQKYVIVVNYNNDCDNFITKYYIDEFNTEYTYIENIDIEKKQYELEESDAWNTLCNSISLYDKTSDYQYTYIKDNTSFDFIQKKSNRHFRKYKINIFFDIGSVDYTLIANDTIDIKKKISDLLRNYKLNLSNKFFSIDMEDAIFLHTKIR